MGIETRRAAQYVRMSTDRQDLSPLIQKDAIASFAAAHGFELVRSYEDQGKSGVEVANRPELRQLLRDVAGTPAFTAILVYDVSRWGRFQDADAAAYYEYHCRMHGVEVVYVSESFSNDLTPASVLIKSMRRVMAAEYSRDIASKSRAGQQRVVDMGYQMGPLPALGYRRCAVSADGTRRKMLEHGERKPALTDRIQWVLGPESEVALVRRIASACAAGVRLESIAALVQAEGWRTDKGGAVSPATLKILLHNEVLIGNFVWGVKSKGGKVIRCALTRRDGSVPRILDDATWAALQARLVKAPCPPAGNISPAAHATARARAEQRPRQLSLALARSDHSDSYRRRLGTVQALRTHTSVFGRALCTAIQAAGLSAAFDTQTNVLAFWSTRLRIRLMWPKDASTWQLERWYAKDSDEHVLVARMAALYQPFDFLLLPLQVMLQCFPRELHETVPPALRRFWCGSPEELLRRLRALCDEAADKHNAAHNTRERRARPAGAAKL